MNITRQSTEAIVNSANSSLLGGGVSLHGCYTLLAGMKVLEECREIRLSTGGCNVGESVITSGGNLTAKHIIHTVGPIWNGGNQNEAYYLKNSYLNSLILGMQNSIKSISFPSIGTGLHAYPIEEAQKLLSNQ
jgi:O-acetyl-ADP-ribose deacetylase (regulator of RNase III)